MEIVTTGDVKVFQGQPLDGNPYKGWGLMLDERKEALRKFKAGEEVGDLTFWAMPRHGAAFQITDPKQTI